ncbi:MAG: hypothetical protein AB7F86_01275 [Bdellovibrionales bacterium]
MLILIDPKKRKELEERIEKLGFSKSVFQVLEVIFYQAMAKDGLEYKDLRPEHRLFDSHLSNEARVKLCCEYVRDWERRNEGATFGFERIYVDEYFDATSAMERFRESLENIERLSQRLTKTSNFLVTKGGKKTLTALRKILEANKNLKLSEFTTSHYFTSYLGISKAIYYDFFEAMGGKKRNKFNEFIAYKIAREHDEAYAPKDSPFHGRPGIKEKFDRDLIKSRLVANKNSYHEFAVKLHNWGLVTPTFIQYLADNRTKDIFIASTGSLPIGAKTA